MLTRVTSQLVARAFCVPGGRVNVPVPGKKAVAGLSGLDVACRQQRRSVQAHAAAAAVTDPKSYKGPQECHGFELVREEYVAEYDSHAMLYRHKKTGSEVMSLVNNDENKTFGAVLRTPPDDSTGIPHILEHSVLCGSRKYPIKEPFVELMKGSLNTFLNAFTYPDRTCYPVASANLQDFYNLVDVYLDAVLFPNCVRDEKTFMQEGWHYELEDAGEELEFKGVVFNEMKGVYSSPDSMFYRYSQEVMFPDNQYGVDSGGDPKVIPDLTFSQFQDFHARYYHPSNARFWFYGDDAPETRLEKLAAYLDQFDARPVDSTIKIQKKFPAPSKVTKYYAAGAGDDAEAGESKAYVGVQWLLEEDQLDLETSLALAFLDFLLQGTSAAPLRKALNESGLGESLLGGGLEDELRQPIYSVGLKGVAPADTDKVQALVLETLERLEKEGFPASSMEAAVNTIEFSLRENNTGRFPRGLSLMLRSMSTWLYDKDPFEPLHWQEPLAAFKARLESGEDVFGPLIRKYLLDNPHRLMLEMLPDTSLGEQESAAEKERLAKQKASLDEGGINEVIKATAELRERQETPDPPQALACMPSLSLADIPREITSVPTAVSEADGATLLRHDLFTNDVLYMELALDLRGVPAELLPLVPLFCRCLTQMGTEGESFVELTERIGRKTGGISASPFVSSKRGTDEPVGYVVLRGKAMADKASDMTDIMHDVLLSGRLDDRDRFKQMVLETKAGLESAMIGSGHSVAAARLDAQRSVAGWASEQMGGYSYLEYIRKLAARLETDWEGIKADLLAIREALVRRAGAMVNMTADTAALSASDRAVADLLASLPGGDAAPAVWTPALSRDSEALLVPTQVNYVGKAGNLYEDAGYKLSGSSYVISKYVGSTWLWDRVRVSGGAYGGFCDFDSHSGMFSYLSYRDPNLVDTVKVYDGTPDWLRGLEMSREELDKAIIGTVGDLDAYQLPDAKGYTAFMRHILGVTDEERQQRREEVLATTEKDFREFAEVLDAVRGPEGSVVAVTSPEQAEKAEKQAPGLFKKTKRVL
ncbi:unnamed protein product [Pedinophyceae sp. YPF-701]|nr:unnamed protein product [Pedinophyceae sp. YPF-701]